MKKKPMKTSITISEPIENVIAWLTEKNTEDLFIKLIQPEKDENVWCAKLHVKSLGDSSEGNLGELLLTQSSERITQMEVTEPRKPENEEVIIWAYPEIIAATMKDFVQSERERLLVEAAGQSRLFLDVDEYYDSIVFEFVDALSRHFEYSSILGNVPDEDLIRPKYRKTEPGDTWETIARDFYGDKKYAPWVIEAMAEHGVHADDLEPDHYLPHLYLLKSPHPEYSISQINSAIDYLQQFGGIVDEERWIPIAAIFGLSVDRVIEILLHIYQVAMSIMENPQEMLITWVQVLQHVRQRKLTEFLSKLQVEFTQK
jgi:hypothetical protein